jgi:hypothetical protein
VTRHVIGKLGETVLRRYMRNSCGACDARCTRNGCGQRVCKVSDLTGSNRKKPQARQLWRDGGGVVCRMPGGQEGVVPVYRRDGVSGVVMSLFTSVL